MVHSINTYPTRTKKCGLYSESKVPWIYYDVKSVLKRWIVIAANLTAIFIMIEENLHEGRTPTCVARKTLFLLLNYSFLGSFSKVDHLEYHPP